jgi:hypothetical protein
MTRRTVVPLTLAAALLAVPGRGGAQEAPKPEAQKPEAPKADRAAEHRGPPATLRVQLVISRFQGEQKLASLPYTFVVTSGGDWTRMRMGVDTPIPVAGPSLPDGKAPTSFQYKNVGTKIDCRASDRGEGYELVMRVENSSALTGPGASVAGAPLFRLFETNLDLILRDGQTVQTVASTDPVTGEVVKIDVTMNVVK